MRMLFILCLWGSFFSVQAAKLKYDLAPVQIALDTYVLLGKTEDFTLKNGGNVVNTAFIVTKSGVLVLDTGSSLRYGKAMIETIKRVTNRPIIRVINTHHHPDHFLGNGAFEGIEIVALEDTIKGMKQEGEVFTDNMYRLVGDWMRGTEPVLPAKALQEKDFSLGQHDFTVYALQGHTEKDLVLFDKKTGVLFVGDLVFYQRALTTPHASINGWLKSLEFLKTIPFKVMVLGHGDVLSDQRGITQTYDYLKWLQTTLQSSAQNGLAMGEVMQISIPEKFKDIPLVEKEFQRSVIHLYPRLEKEVLQFSHEK